MLNDKRHVLYIMCHVYVSHIKLLLAAPFLKHDAYGTLGSASRSITLLGSPSRIRSCAFVFKKDRIPPFRKTASRPAIRHGMWPCLAYANRHSHCSHQWMPSIVELNIYHADLLKDNTVRGPITENRYFQPEGCHEVWNLNFVGFIEDAIS